MANSPKTKTKRTETDNPLWAYSTAIETLVGVARGKIRSEMRLEAARTLLDHTSIPPSVDWGVEFDD